MPLMSSPAHHLAAGLMRCAFGRLAQADADAISRAQRKYQHNGGLNPELDSIFLWIVNHLAQSYERGKTAIRSEITPWPVDNLARQE